VIEIQRRLEEDKVLHEWKKHHRLQKRNKAGRYSKTFSLVVARLEALAKNFTVAEVRPSRGRRQSETRRVQGLKSKAQDKRRQAEAHDKVEYGDEQEQAWYREGMHADATRAEDEARQAEADLKGDLEGARYRLEILKREVVDRKREMDEVLAKPWDEDADPNDLHRHGARTLWNDAVHHAREHIKVLNKLEREAKAKGAKEESA
jgi:hypothetical protein